MFDETYFTAAIRSFLWREFNYETHSTYKAKTTIIVWCVGGAAAAERVQQPRHAGNRECLWGVQEAQEEQGRSWSLCQWQKTEHLKLQPFTEWGGGGLLLLSPDEGGPFPPQTGQGGSFSPSLDEGGPPPPHQTRGVLSHLTGRVGSSPPHRTPQQIKELYKSMWNFICAKKKLNIEFPKMVKKL